MGYSLAHTPLRDLTHHALILFHSSSEESIRLTHCLPFLKHPYIRALLGYIVLPEASHVPYAQLSEKILHALPSFLQSFIGKCSSQRSFFDEFKTLLKALEEANMDKQQFYQLDKAYFTALYNGLQTLQTANIVSYFSQLSLTGKQQLFHYLLHMQRIPFVGEPLKGLQIMGTLETRNIDFDCVIILDLNEGSWPVAPDHMLSCVPQFLRQAYSLATYAYSDTLYAYTFYRLLQRTKTAYLLHLHSIDTAHAEKKQKSRFLYQLEYDAHPHQLQILSAKSHAAPIFSNILEIQKTTSSLSKLMKEDVYTLNVSDINVYLHCPLQFFYRKIMKLSTSLSVTAQERIDLGKIAHKVLQNLYTPLKGKALSIDDFRNAEVELSKIIEEACKSHYKLPKKSKILGKYIIFYKILEKYIKNVVSFDKKCFTQGKKFCIRGLEQEVIINLSLKDGRKCSIKGKIDRVDECREGYVVTDYKTGKVNQRQEKISEELLFERENSRRWDAARQVALYALMYEKQKKETCHAQVLTLPTLNAEPPICYRFSAQKIEEKLLQLVEEIFDIHTPFTTRNTIICEDCPYQILCASTIL